MKKVLSFMTFMVIVLSMFGVNNYLQFNGLDDYINFTNSPSYSETMTIEAWIKTTSNQEINDIVCWGDAGGYDNVQFRTCAGKLDFGTHPYGGNWISCQSSATVNTNEWTHVAVVKNDTSVQLYINGIADGSGVNANSMNVNYMLIGKYVNGENYYDGNIDELRIWNDVRTQTEIRQNMYKEISNPSSEGNLVAYYKFNEAFGTTLTDSKSTNNGTLINLAGNEWVTSPAMFGPRNSLYFNGINNYVSFANNPPYSEVMTIEAWIKTTNSHDVNDIVCWGNTGRTDNVQVRTSSGKFEFGSDPESGSWVSCRGSIDVNTNEWTHVAAVKNNSSIQLYVNGLEDGTGINTNSMIINYMLIGKYVNDEFYFNGEMDEVRIWNTARTANQIRENMCKSITGSEANLLAYYNFNNLSGSILQDLSSNAYDGSLVDMGDGNWTTSIAFNQWLNTDSSAWATNSNWSNGVPSVFDNIGIFNYDVEPVITGTPSCDNIYIGSGASVNLNSNMTVYGNMILDNNMDLNGQTIVLGEQATLIENNGHLYGELGQIQTTRSLSNINDNVAGLGAVITEDGNLGTTTIIRGHKAQGHQGIDRYYQINTQNNPTAATLVFNYLDSELNGQNESIIKLFKSTDGVEWIEQDSELNAANNTITLTGIDSFSYWSAGQAGAGEALPITLSSFTVSLYNHLPTLSWTTESESNNLGWNVYRANSNDLAQTIRINEEFIHGSGNTSEQTQYTYYDNEPIVTGEEYYYWIESVGFGNEIKYHGPISILVGSEQPGEDNPEVSKEFGLFPNYPNPFNPSTTISFASEKSGNCELTVYDLRGRRVKTLFSGHVNAEVTNSIVWNGDDDNNKKVASGIYFYRLTGNGKTVNRKMILMK